MDDIEIPECPITREKLSDPVVDPDGNTYEKKAILAWLTQHGTSPITRKPLRADQLVPNRALRDLIEAKEKALKMKPADIQKTAIVSAPVSKEDVSFNCYSPSSGSTIISVKGPDANHTYPSHICCVIDTSGSMGSYVTVKAADGSNESDGLTLLDLVKHATSVIIHSLGDNDMLSLIEFNSSSTCVLKPTLMDNAGKKKAKDALDSLYPTGSTNLAAGISHSVEVSSQVPNSHFSSIFLLTDGVPDDQDLDYTGILRRKLEKTPLFGTINTFGFGYDLNSGLLRKIAQEGDGFFGFIPDGGFVGTIFINALANTRTTYATNVALAVDASAPALVGSLRHVVNGSTTKIFLPPLRFGQSSEFVFDKTNLKFSLTFEAIGGHNIHFEKPDSIQLPENEVNYHLLRATVAKSLFDAQEAVMFRSGDIAGNDIREKLQVSQGASSQRASDSRIDALCKDLEGQVKEALSREDWFKRWGKHFFISLAFAHLRQIRNNFKDPGVQVYGGSLFQKLQDDYQDLFISLPPPKPSGVRFSDHGSPVSASAAPPVSMSRYYNAGGVCFAGSCEVELAAGFSRKIQDLRKGDIVSNGAIVECIVETFCMKPAPLVEIGLNKKLLITPYHPVYQDGWKFPIDISPLGNKECSRVFNLVLSKNHYVVIDGVKCVTMGHNFKDEIVRHDYFGSDKVVEDLKKLDGWNAGYIRLMPDLIQRGPDGTISRIGQEFLVDILTSQ
ncbi:hypothetical protein MP638_004149 [Amoeboaphelidium occidentale]|nr:hypothetical protein MP638_004149 [Amoeboaphelidium occidentale]